MSRLFAICGITAVLFASTCAKASVREITFQNKENDNADDLHIVFNSDTKVTKNPFGNDRTTGDHDPTHNFWGMTVANASPKQDTDPANTVKLAFSSDALDLTIKEWWWTKGGDAKGNGNQLGKKHTDTNGTQLSFLDRPASGDGIIQVNINGQANIFTTTAGFSASAEAAAFSGFLTGLTDGDFALINSALFSSTRVDFVGNLLGDPATELSVDLLHQDSSQTVSLAPIGTPEPSSLFLGGFGMGCGLLYWLRSRRRTRKALSMDSLALRGSVQFAVLLAACFHSGRVAADITVSTPMKTVDDEGNAISDYFTVYYKDEQGDAAKTSVVVTYAPDDSKFKKAERLSAAINAQLKGLGIDDATSHDPGSETVNQKSDRMTGVQLDTNHSHENEDKVKSYDGSGNAVKAIINYEFDPTGLNFQGGTSSFGSSLSFHSPDFGNVQTGSTLSFGNLSSPTLDGITADTYAQLLAGLPSALRPDLNLNLSQDAITFTFPDQSTGAEVSNFSSDTGTALGVGLIQAGASVPEPSSLALMVGFASAILVWHMIHANRPRRQKGCRTLSWVVRGAG
jgi:hypothetical protein